MGIPNPTRLPYFPEQALEALKGTQNLILAGAKSPVAFFGYQGLPSSLVPEGCAEETLARVEDDVAGALEALADALGAPKDSSDSGGEEAAGLPPANSIPQASAPRSPRCNPRTPSSWMRARPREVHTAGWPAVRLPHTSARAHRRRDRAGTSRARPAPRSHAPIGASSSFKPTAAGCTRCRRYGRRRASNSMSRRFFARNRAYRILQMEAARAGSVEMGRKTEASRCWSLRRSDGRSSRKASASRACGSRRQMIW